MSTGGNVSGQREGARLLRHGLINAVGRILIGAVGIVLVPLMLAGLGAEMYGVWIAALALNELAASIDLGLGWAVSREVAREPDSEDTASFASSAAKALLLIGVAGAVTIAGAGYFVSGSFELSAGAREAAPAVFVVMGIAFAGEALIGYSTAVLYGLRMFGVVGAFHLGLALARAAGVVALLAVGYGVVALASWHAATSWLAAVAGVQILAARRPTLRIRPGRLDPTALRRHLGFSLISQLTSLGTAMIWRVPVLLLGAMRNAAAIVPYHLGQRLPILAYSIGWRAAEAVFPAASQHQAADDAHQSRQVLLVGTRWTVLSTLPLLLIMSGVSPWFLRLWLGSASAEVITVLRLTAVAVLAHLFGATALHLLWGVGRGVQVFVVLAGMAAAIVVSAWLLVPEFGAVGAASSAIVPMLLGSFLLVELAARHLGTSSVAVIGASFRGLLLPSALTLGIMLFASDRFDSGGWLAMLFSCGAAASCFLGMFLGAGSRLEERKLLYQVFFGGSRRDDGDPSPAPVRPRILRSTRDFLANLRYYLYDESHTHRDHYDQLFRQEGDPWGYETMPERGADRFAGALAMLDAVTPASHRIESALEIGCAEGLFTELLEPHCGKLLAVDISEIALERARARCAGRPAIRFGTWDLMRDALPDDRYDLVVVMGVLDNYMRISHQKRVRERIVTLVRPGGYLLVESTRTGGDLEDTWWRRVLHRGRWLNHFVAQHPHLETVEVRSTPICVQTLCRKRQ